MIRAGALIACVMEGLLDCTPEGLRVLVVGMLIL